MLTLPWYFTLLLAITVDRVSASMPVLICVNERAEANECGAEKSQAMDAVASWFTTFNAQTRKHRELVDCTRFCQQVDHFVFHAPCDCDKRRYLVENANGEETTVGVESPSTKSTTGPIQILQKFILALPGGRCKEVFELSKCMVNFVSSYKYDKDAAADEGNSFKLPEGYHMLGFDRLQNGTHTSPHNKTFTEDLTDVPPGYHVLDFNNLGNETSSTAGTDKNATNEGNVTVPSDDVKILEVDVFDPASNTTESIGVNDTESIDVNGTDVGSATDSTGIGEIIEQETWDPETNNLTEIIPGGGDRN